MFMSRAEDEPGAMSRAMRCAAVALSLVLSGLTGASAQMAERRAYTMSAGMRQNLELHQFDPGQIEGVVNGVALGLASGDLQPILDNAAPTLRVTSGTTNEIVQKDKLASFKDRLLKDEALRRDILDEGQFIVKGDEVALARGAIWIDVQCLDDDCTKKKSAIVTFNLR